MLLDHRRAQRRTEQVRVQEVPDIGRAEHVVAQRPVLFHRQPQPADAGLRPVEGHQHVIEPEEHGQLGQHRQAAQNRVEPVLLLQLLHLQRHPLAVLAVLLLQRLDLRLQLLHLAGGADLPNERLVQDRAQGEHEEHHRQSPGEEVRRPEHEAERLVPDPHDRRHRVIDDVQAEPTKHASRSLLAIPGYPQLSSAASGSPRYSSASPHDSCAASRRSGIGSHPPLCHGPHFSSRTTASHPPLTTPYSRQRLHRVLATRRREPTRRQPQRRDGVPVQLDDEDHRACRRRTRRPRHRDAPLLDCARRKAVRSSCSSLAEIAYRLPGSARITTRSAGSNSPITVRATWRSRRATRCRCTAVPTDFDTTRPILGPSPSPES